MEDDKGCEVQILGENLDEDIIELLYSNKTKTGGGEIEELFVNIPGTTAFITFKLPSDAEDVVRQQFYTHKGQTFTAQWPQPDTDSSPEAPRVVEVKGHDLDESTLDILFTNKSKSGGGEIERIEVNSDGTSALITFVDSEDAAEVVERSSVVFGKKTYTASWPESEEAEDGFNVDEEIPQRVVQISGIVDLGSDELDMLYTNCSRTGGGPIEAINVSEADNSALITFESEEDAARVVEKGEVVFRANTLTATWPKKADRGKCNLKTVKITGIGDLDGSTLEMLYSNKKKTGGGEIEDLQVDSAAGFAVITFTEEDVAARVVEVETVVIANKTLTASWLENETTSSLPKNKVLLSGVGSVDRETLDLLFTNPSKTGGGPIEKIEMQNEEGYAIITFMEENDAANVVQQKETVFGGNIFVASWPVEKETTPAPRVVQISDIGDLDSDTLSLLYSNKGKTGGGEIEDILIQEASNSALITFKSAEDAASVVSQGMAKIRGKYLVASWPVEEEPPPPASVVLVSGLEDLDADTLEMLYSNSSKTGGGPIEHIDCDTVPGSALITFVSPDDAAKVVSIEVTKLGRRTLHASWPPEEKPKPPQTSVVISGVGELSSDDLEMLYSNPNKSKGGPIIDITVDEASDSAVITFTEHEVAASVVEHCTVKLGNQKLTASWPKEDTPSSPQTTVQITGIGELDTDTLNMLYTNVNRTGGGPIEDISLRPDEDMALITFTHAEDAASVIQKGSTKFGKQNLVHSWPLVEEPRCLVKITGAESFDEETLRMLYTNEKKTGGGPIEHVEIRESVLITFACNDVAERVVTQKEAKLGNQILLASWPESSKTLSPRLVVQISGTAGCDEESLKMLFSNKKKSGGGVISDIEMRANITLITYSDPKDAAAVVERGNIKFGKQSFSASWPDSGDDADTGETLTRPSTSNKEVNQQTFNTVAVEGLQGDEDADILRMFFGNHKKSGGGKVKDIQLQPENKKAFVTFVSEEDAARIASKTKIKFRDTKLLVCAMDSVDSSLSCAILVKNIPTDVKQDSLTLIFEQCDIHGEDEAHEECVILKEDDSSTAVITMASPQAVDNILKYHKKKPLSMKRTKLDVSRLQPAPPGRLVNGEVESDKIIFRFIDAGMNVDELTTFIEEGAKADIDHILFTEKMGVILVYFTTAADYNGMKLKCMSRPFEGKMLGIERVPVTTMVQVLNVTSDIEDTLEPYMKNTKRSHGGPVKSVVEFNFEKGYAIVNFKSSATVKSICQKKKHNWNLVIREYYESVGVLRAGVDYSIPSAWLPEPLEVEWDVLCVKFVLGRPQIKHEIEKEMASVYASVVWPEDTNSAIVSLKCDLDATSPAFAAAVKTWQDDISSKVADVLQSIVVEEIDIGPDCWDEVLKIIESVSNQDDNITLDFNENLHVIAVVGKEQLTQYKTNQVHEALNTAKQKMYIQQNTVTKVMEDVDELKIKLMEINCTAETIQQKYEHVTVTVTEHNEVKLCGLKENVENAYQDILKFLGEIKSTSLQFKPAFQELLKNEETIDYLKQRIGQDDIVWELKSGYIQLYSTSQSALTKTRKRLQEQLVIEDLRVPEKCSLMSSKSEFENLLKNLERNERGKLKIESDLRRSEIKLTGIASCVEAAQSQLQQIFENHRIETLSVQLLLGKVKFIKAFKQDEITSIQQKLSKHGVSIAFPESQKTISISGTDDGIKLAKREIDDLSEKIIHDSYPVEKQALADYIHSQDGMKKIEQLQDHARVIVVPKWKTGRRPLPKKPPPSTYQHGSKQNEELSFEENNLTFKVVQGDIISFNAGAIINPTSTKLELGSGMVSRTMSERAGPEMQDELRQKFPSGIQQGEIAPTFGYKLPAGSVYHAACPKGSQTDCEKVLTRLIDNCLKQAMKDKLRTIAFPSIGGGSLAINRKDFAKTIISCVKNFAKDNGNEVISTVFVVLHRKDSSTYSAFEAELGDGDSSAVGDDQDEEGQYDVIPADKTGASVSYSSINSIKKEVQIGRLTFQILMGDVTKENTDAIVNATDNKFQNKGGLSRAILSAAGSQVDRELQQAGYVKNALTTTGGHLPCKKIIHAASGHDEDSWKKFVQICLLQADQHQLKSISFPAIGTGRNQDESCRKNIAAWIYEVWENYRKLSPSTELELIRLVTNSSNIVSDYADCLTSKTGPGYLKRLSAGFQKYWSGDSNEPPAKRSSDKPADLPDLDIYCERRSHAEDFMRKLADIHSSQYKVAYIDSETYQEKIRKLKPKQEIRINELGQSHRVKIEIQKGRVKRRIKIEGDAQDVFKAMTAVSKALDDAVQAIEDNIEAEELGKKVCWKYFSDGKMVPYPEKKNGKIEKAYKDKKDTYEMKDPSGDIWVIDFATKELTLKGGDGTKVSVSREAVGDIPLPDLWEPMPTGKKGHLFAVQSGTPEYNTVKSNIMATAGGNITSIVKIERVQNPELYKLYVLSKEGMEKSNPPDTKNEVPVMWHGTRPESVANIIENGLNRAYKSTTAYGQGVYFAINSSYSAGRYSKPDSEGNKRMFQCRVLKGVTAIGNKKMLQPPPRDPPNQDIPCDSTTNNIQKPDMYVTYDDSHNYPEYLITFRVP